MSDEALSGRLPASRIRDCTERRGAVVRGDRPITVSEVAGILDIRWTETYSS